MVIADFLEKNARLYGEEVALVEINPSEERDRAVTWRDFSLIENTRPDLPYREMTWAQFDKKANRFANLLLSRGVKRGTKVGILLMNCLEWLPIYFGVLKAGAIAVPMNFRYSGEEIEYCVDLADVEVLVFGPEFTERITPLVDKMSRVKFFFYVGREVPQFAESYLELVNYCSQSAPPVALEEDDYAAIYFSSGTTGFPKAILHNHRALDGTEPPRTDPGRRIPLHSATLPHRRKDALVRQSHFRQPRRSFAGREAGMDIAGRHRGKVHHRLAAGALGTGSAGCH